MKKSVFLPALSLLAVGFLGACAEESSPTYQRTAEAKGVIFDEDGREFDVTITYDPAVISIDLAVDLIYAIEVVGVTPIDPVVPSTNHREIVPQNPAWNQPGDVPVGIIVTPDVPIGNDFEWRWIDDIEETDLIDIVEDVCPPWH